MNKMSRYSIVLLVLISLLGCSNRADHLNELNNQGNVSQSKDEAPNAVNSFDSSIYYASEGNPVIETTDNQILWKEGEARLTATIAKAEEEQAFESKTVISSIIVEAANAIASIKLDRKPLGVQSVSLSHNNQLAIHVRDHEGSRLFILNLLSGSQSVLNNLPDKMIASEKIDNYNWSPDGNTIAFGFGDIGSSYIALYNTQNNTYSELSKKDYRLITAVVWLENGQGFDFLSKTDDAENSTVLYRYTLSDHSIRKVTNNLSENDQAILATLLPTKVEQ